MDKAFESGLLFEINRGKLFKIKSLNGEQE
jgi:hypothetical protein